MARKSRWQQFADNFNSVYGAFNKAAQDWESGDIMSEKPEELIDEETGATYWNYGDKRYDKQITDEQLRGLQYNRMADMKSRWGDHADAMDMRTKYQDLQEKIRSNRLGEATFQADAMKPVNDNLLTLSRIGLNDANRDQMLQETADRIKLFPLEMQEKALSNAEKILGNQAKIIANYIQEGSKDAQVEGYTLENDRTRSQTNVNNSNAGLNASRTKGQDISNQFDADTYESRVNRQISDDTAGISDNEVKVAENQKSMAAHEAWANWSSDVASGLYENEAEKVEGFLGYMSNVDPVGAAKLREGYNDSTLSFITDETMRYQAEIKRSLSKGGIDGVMAFIDEDNGNDLDVEIRKNDSGFELVETYATGDDKGTAKRVIASAKDKDGLGKAAMQAASPDKLLPYLAEQADINLKEAQTLYNHAKTASEGLGKALTKDQWAISRFAKNPKDPFAAAILLGDGYTMDDIASMVTDGNLTSALGNAEGGSETNASGDGEGTPPPKKEKVDNVGLSGTRGVEQIDKTASINEQKKQKTLASKQLRRRYVNLKLKLDKDYIPNTLDSNLPADEYKKQKLRDEALDWMIKNEDYFVEHPNAITAMEDMDDPVDWYVQNIKSKKDEDNKKGLKK